MGYYDVLKLPLVTFWSFNRQVDRLRAEVDQRQLRVATAAASENPEAIKVLGETLEREVGMPVRVEKKFDQKQFDALKAKFANMRVVQDTHTE